LSLRLNFRRTATIATTRNGFLNPLPVPLINVVVKTKAEEPKRPHFDRMPTSSSGMSEAQRIDLMAAIEGRITWRRYFEIWGDLSP
jgi:hypothetical protein